MLGLHGYAPAGERSAAIDKAAKIGDEHIFNAPHLQFVFNISAKAGTAEAMNIPTRKMIEAMDVDGMQKFLAVQAVIENAFDNGHVIKSKRLGDDNIKVVIQPDFGH